MERSRYHRATIIADLAVVSPSAGLAEARSHPEGRVGVPAMVARVLPAVVSITTRQIERDQFNEPVPTRGLGSGFIVDRQGHVLTNNHVIEGAQETKVALTDGRLFRATRVGADRFQRPRRADDRGQSPSVSALGRLGQARCGRERGGDRTPCAASSPSSRIHGSPGPARRAAPWSWVLEEYP